jgi:hypothetical protein
VSQDGILTIIAFLLQRDEGAEGREHREISLQIDEAAGCYELEAFCGGSAIANLGRRFGELIDRAASGSETQGGAPRPYGKKANPDGP